MNRKSEREKRGKKLRLETKGLDKKKGEVEKKSIRKEGKKKKEERTNKKKRKEGKIGGRKFERKE